MRGDADMADDSFCNRSADGSLTRLLHVYAKRASSIGFILDNDRLSNNIKFAPFYEGVREVFIIT